MVRIAVGFVGVIVCLVILGSLARDVRDQEANALDAIATPLLRAFASPGLDHDAALPGRFWPRMPRVVAKAPRRPVPHRRDRRQHRPGWDDETVLRTPATAPALGASRARLQFLERPFDELDRPFLALALLVWQIRGRPTGVVAVAVALVLSLTIGISRIYLGYRYFTDVLGGFTTSDYDATRSSDRGAIGAGRSPIDPPVWHPDATPCPVSTGRKAHSCC